jgi:hypothetical protein
MTTAEPLPVNDTIAPLTRQQARALDTKIRAQRERLIADAEKLVDLIGQAERDQIHVALGCSSRAWFADAVRIPRKALTAITRK